MKPVDDGELLMYHYRDGLDPARNLEIEQALFFDAALRLRLAALRETLELAEDAWPEHSPEPGFERRLWARLEPRLDRQRERLSWRERAQRWLEPLRPAPLAFASLLLAAVGIGYIAGQRDLLSPPGSASAPLLAGDASQRVLAAHLAAHLEQAERTLLVAQNSPDEGESAQRLASDLLESNRLYAIAAERAGKPALARFLRELEPVLIELSNESGPVAPALGDEIRERDLAFKSRAAAALARREFASDVSI